MTVTEVVEELLEHDVAVPGRAGKTISDALRWEVRKGRVRRIGPATYAFGWMPASTGRWMRSELRNHHT